MNRVKLRHWALVPALALLLSGCGGEMGPETPAPEISAPVETVTPAPPTPSPAPVWEEPVWGELVVHQDYLAGDGETVLLQLNCTLPKVENPERCPAGEAINAWYAEEARARLTEAEEQYELQLADYEISKESGFEFQPMVQEMTSEVVYQQDGIYSVKRTLYVEFGGPYPLTYRLSEQFDAETGARLTFADLFTDAEAVMSRVADAFWALPELAGGVISREEVAVACQPENFYLTGEGYVFWIQSGSLEVTHSPLEVTIPFDQLADLSRYG